MTRKTGALLLETGERLANDIVRHLQPYCSRIEIAGSIRRRENKVNDIDIVMIPKPSEAWELYSLLRQWGANTSTATKIMNFRYGIATVDLYVTTNEDWATTLLIRTGSKEHNIKLCQLARTKSMILHADGSGLFTLEAQGCEGVEARVAGETEESIFHALGLAYLQPHERR